MISLQTLIGDSCLVGGHGLRVNAGTERDDVKVFCCFVVWERNIWAILLPLLLLVSSTGDIYFLLT
jgi:hypothetical protein